VGRDASPLYRTGRGRLGIGESDVLPTPLRPARSTSAIGDSLKQHIAETEYSMSYVVQPPLLALMDSLEEDTPGRP
jgi:hypothetical protein